ncbi:hypothetical protein VTK73DRAFT_2026 [Phialemonium thermophilum]|uniref:Uncharacterized protein n=1 Tax=Phialemonium thermophilum TaxID=223376 RepID=A0ABR3X6J7_9PEZI
MCLIFGNRATINNQKQYKLFSPILPPFLCPRFATRHTTPRVNATLLERCNDAVIPKQGGSSRPRFWTGESSTIANLYALWVCSARTNSPS